MAKIKKPSDKIFAFLRTLKLASAEWYGKPFEPLPWFQEVVRGIYDNVNDQGVRNIREAFIEIPRKNAKSMSIAGLALYHALLDGEKDGQIYIVASDTSNAGVIFKMLTSMIYQNKVLRALCEVREYKKEVKIAKTDSVIKAMSSDADNKHGLSPSLVIYDELHTARNRELYDVMQTGMSARRQPLIIAITTAGNDTNSFCYEQYTYAKNVLKGVIKDPSFYAYIREVEQGEDWTDRKNWEKANPSWGITVKPEDLEHKFFKAKNQISAENNFRRLHLNQWVEQATRWLSLETWNTRKTNIDTTGLPCWCGLDLSSNEDLTAFVQVFKYEGDYLIKPHFFLPMDTIEHHPMNKFYKTWEQQGFINGIVGNTNDCNVIIDYINDLDKINPIEAIAYDPYMSRQMVILMQDKYKCIEYSQGFRTMSPASKDFEKGILQGTIFHYDHPVMNWCVNNVMVEEDRQENIKPVKPSKYAKIDGVIGAIMGCDLASRMTPSTSIYETRDLIVI